MIENARHHVGVHLDPGIDRAKGRGPDILQAGRGGPHQRDRAIEYFHVFQGVVDHLRRGNIGKAAGRPAVRHQHRALDINGYAVARQLQALDRRIILDHLYFIDKDGQRDVIEIGGRQ